jgi:hypothetical protein
VTSLLLVYFRDFVSLVFLPCSALFLIIFSCIAWLSLADVLQGQGLQMSADVRVRQAVDCWQGSVGMSTDTPALYARPCETCPRFMTTLQPLSTSFSACRAIPGYTPWNNTEAVIGVPCAIGFYKPTLSNDNCTQCPAYTSTLRTASISVNNCTGEQHAAAAVAAVAAALSPVNDNQTTCSNAAIEAGHQRNSKTVLRSLMPAALPSLFCTGAAPC